MTDSRTCSLLRFSVTPDGKEMVISDAVTKHSHPHDEDSFQSLPPKRRLTEAEREEACNLLEVRMLFDPRQT